MAIQSDTTVKKMAEQRLAYFDPLTKLANRRLLTDCLQQAIAQAEIIGNKILAEISRPYQLASHNYSSSGNIGVTMFDGGKHKFDELMEQADIALYQARQSKEK